MNLAQGEVISDRLAQEEATLAERRRVEDVLQENTNSSTKDNPGRSTSYIAGTPDDTIKHISHPEDLKPIGDICVVTWNVQGEKDIAEIEEALAEDLRTWDLMLLQEVSNVFDASDNVKVKGASTAGESQQQSSSIDDMREESLTGCKVHARR